jgi:hypothetical protein
MTEFFRCEAGILCEIKVEIGTCKAAKLGVLMIEKGYL